MAVVHPTAPPCRKDNEMYVMGKEWDRALLTLSEGKLSGIMSFSTMPIMLWLLPFIVAITQVSIPSWRASCFPIWTVMEQCGSNIPRCHNKRMTNKPIAVLGKWSAHLFIYWAWTWWNIDSNHNIHPSYRPPNLSDQSHWEKFWFRWSLFNVVIFHLVSSLAEQSCLAYYSLSFSKRLLLPARPSNKSSSPRPDIFVARHVVKLHS